MGMKVSLTEFILFILFAVGLGFVALALFGGLLGLELNIGTSFFLLLAIGLVMVFLMLGMTGFKIEKHVSLLILVFVGVFVAFILKGKDWFPGLFSISDPTSLAFKLSVPSWLVLALLGAIIIIAWVRLRKKR